MTQTVGTAAPVPAVADPSVELDLTNPAAAVPVQKTTVEYTGTITIAADKPQIARAYTLVGVLSALDMVTLQNAQESQNFLKIIEAVPRLVIPEQRQDLRDFFLSDPVSDDDKIQLDDVIKALNDGLEQIAARPTVKS